MTYLQKIKAWADAQPSYREAWQTCERGDWMMWIAAKQRAGKKKIILSGIEIARTVQHLMADPRLLKALDVAERYSRGDATKIELNMARHDAHDVVYLATRATRVAEADYAKALRAESAAKAACLVTTDAAATVRAAAAATESEEESLKNSADIIRKHIKFEDLRIKPGYQYE